MTNRYKSCNKQLKEENKMEHIFATICAAVLAGDVTVSDAATIDCVRGDMPEVSQSQMRFLNRGAGAQFNFIVDNAQHFTFMDGVTWPEVEDDEAPAT